MRLTYVFAALVLCLSVSTAEAGHRKHKLFQGHHVHKEKLIEKDRKPVDKPATPAPAPKAGGK